MKTSVIIMAGGIGERLWPLSREKKPKQFLKIIDNKSLIEQTIDRALQITEEENIFIITGKRYKEAFFTYISNFKKDNIIYEPIGRDTAAAVALGVLTVKEKIGNSNVVIIPADPIIKEEDIFVNTIKEAIKLTSETKNIVIVGIKPTRAETGYGYIKLDKNIKGNEYIVHKFVEKPDLENAKKFLEDGSYLWNSGMFIWDSESILDSINKFMPDTFNKVNEALKNINDENKALEIFNSIDKISFDFGIMEKLEDIICIKSEFFWDDLGAFSALGRIHDKDENNNVVIGQVYLKNSNNNIIINDDDDLLTLNGINNTTIVKSNGVVLMYPNNEDSKIKEILKDIREKNELNKYRELL
ncbi:mannose-1-phosphate guanylyltransferase [uncultured Brachyspira sp.]|uniref:mannose-1-phosphate guanylyltransferase n=1 Tax=uncultured Brachyspira sp. TaxID=221953 RepID=UPI0025D108CB|nr:sugar phosphate nucleotidyltransferase [uncultured Brachyspira sp.]